MFYCTEILRKNDGKFAAIWLASVYGKNLKKILTRPEITAVDIEEACNGVMRPNIRFSLRLQSNLMLGILRVYYEQVSHFCEIIKRAWKDLRITFSVDMRLIDLPNKVLSKDACTLPDPLMDDRDFPIFLSQRFPALDGDDDFIRVGFHSPVPSNSSTPLSPPYIATPGTNQAKKEEITIPDRTVVDDEKIQVPDDDITPPPLPVDDGIDDEIFPSPEDQPPPVDVVPPPVDVVPPPVDVVPPPVDVVPPPVDVVPPPEEDAVQIIDESTGRLVEEVPDSESRKRRRGMLTPNDRIEPVEPGPPRKRRRGKAVDVIRKLSDETMKRNHLTVSVTLKDEIIDLPIRLSAQELLNNPSRPELRCAPFMNMWQENTIPQPILDEEVDGFTSSTENSAMTPEVVRVGEETEGSVDVSGISTSILPNITPVVESPDIVPNIPGSAESVVSESSRGSLETIPEISVREEDLPTIPPIDDTNVEEESFTRELQSELVQVMGENDETSFSEIFPPENTRKARAAKGLFQLLEWHRRNVVVLSQPGANYSEIYVARGLHF